MPKLSHLLLKVDVVDIEVAVPLLLVQLHLDARQAFGLEDVVPALIAGIDAAAEAAVGLAIIIAVFRARATLAVDRIDLMKL